MDKAQRKQQLNAWRDQQRKAAIAAFPLPANDLRSLFTSLDESLSAATCDHSLRFTIAWLSARKVEQAPVVEWLRSQGGYCDCEVLANVEEKVDEATGGAG
jgi:hypothetical protein